MFIEQNNSFVCPSVHRWQSSVVNGLLSQAHNNEGWAGITIYHWMGFWQDQKSCMHIVVTFGMSVNTHPPIMAKGLHSDRQEVHQLWDVFIHWHSKENEPFSWDYTELHVYPYLCLNTCKSCQILKWLFSSSLTLIPRGIETIKIEVFFAKERFS